MKKLTHEEFLEQFKNNPHFNDIELLEKYVNGKTPIKCKCKKCEHEWSANAYNLTHFNTGCPSCALAKNKKMPFENKVKELSKYSVSKIMNINREVYRNGHWDIEVTCKTCGYTYVKPYHDLFKLKNCPQCWKENRLTCEETFLRKFKETKQSESIILKSHFIDSLTKIKCECSVCGRKWEANPNDLLIHGCLSCSSKERGKQNIKGFDEFKEDLNKKFKHIKCLNYISAKSNDSLFYCEKHNRKFNTSIYRVLNSVNGGCEDCYIEQISKKNSSTSEEFQEKLSKLNPSLKLISEYKNNQSYVDIKCMDCGKVMNVRANQILSRPKCLYCQDGLSFPNKFIRSVLFQSNADYFEFEYSPKWANKKRYDVYFEKDGKKYIIEMDGKQHHESWIYGTIEYQQTNDKLKNELAKEQGIKVIRIDCSKQHLIKNNLLNSELSSILDLSKIDFNECTKFAFSSLMKSVCERYENDKTICSNDLVDIFQLSKGTIIRYLRFGNEIGLCTFNKSESKIRMNKLRRI